MQCSRGTMKPCPLVYQGTFSTKYICHVIVSETSVCLTCNAAHKKLWIFADCRASYSFASC